MKWYSFMAPVWPKDLCKAYSEYLVRICGTTTAENVLLKLMTFLCRMPMVSMK